MKKFLSLVLALIMTMSLVTISAGATEYRDLTDKDEIQYEEAVAVLNRIGVITGYEDGSFRPETELTRGAAAKIIVSLLIGPEAASNLPNTTAPYPDVPASHTFAGVISYCKTAKIISGYGDGTFKPGNSLTGFAFAKMLLGALGYKSDIEGFVDTGWTMNVAKVGNVTGLFDRLDFDGAAAVNRETACQLALNTLKATMVTYGGTTMVTGAQTLAVQGTQAMYVTSNNREINANINRRVINATNNEMTLEFGEEHFKDLRLEHDKYDPAYDDFGHPSNEWSWKKVTIGTFKLPADFTFDKQMSHLEDTVATKEKALGLRNYDTWSTDHRSFTANWSTASSNNQWNSPFADATQVTINGWNARVHNTGYTQSMAPSTTLNGNLYSYDAYSTKVTKETAPTIAEIADLTDNGVTVEVYVCPVDADFITNVVVTRTQLMKVKRIGSDYVTLEDIEPDSRGPRKDGDLGKITGYNAFSVDNGVIDVKDSNYDAYNALKDLKAGDRVAVVPFTPDDGKTWEVGEAYVPETVSGAFTKVDTYANVNKKEGSAVAITVGGTSYPINEWNKDMLNVTGSKIKATKKDITLYLAKDGTVLWADEIGNSDAWMVVGDYYQATSSAANGKVGWFVHGWTTGGEEVDLDLGTIRGDAEKYAPGELVHYYIAEAGNGEYALEKPNKAGINHYKSGAEVKDTPKTSGEGVYEVAQYTIDLENKGLATRYQIKTRNGALSLENYDNKDSTITKYNTRTASNANEAVKRVDKRAADPVQHDFSYSNLLYDGVKFIFVNFDGANGEVETIDFRSGVQNVDYQDLVKYNSVWKNVGTNIYDYVVSAAEAYVNDKGVVKAVVIKADSSEADLSKIAVITDTPGDKNLQRTGAEGDRTNGLSYAKQYVTGPNFNIAEEKTGYFDKDYKIGTILVISEKDGLIVGRNFHSTYFNNGNPDTLYVEGISPLVRANGGNSEAGFLIGQGTSKVWTLNGSYQLKETGNDDRYVLGESTDVYLLGNKYVSGFDTEVGADTLKGLIRVDSGTKFVDLRAINNDTIDSLGDLLDYNLDTVKLRLLVNGSLSSDGFRRAYAVIVEKAEGKTVTSTGNVTLKTSGSAVAVNNTFGSVSFNSYTGKVDWNVNFKAPTWATQNGAVDVTYTLELKNNNTTFATKTSPAVSKNSSDVFSASGSETITTYALDNGIIKPTDTFSGVLTVSWKYANVEFKFEDGSDASALVTGASTAKMGIGSANKARFNPTFTQGTYTGTPTFKLANATTTTTLPASSLDFADAYAAGGKAVVVTICGLTPPAAAKSYDVKSTTTGVKAVQFLVVDADKVPTADQVATLTGWSAGPVTAKKDQIILVKASKAGVTMSAIAAAHNPDTKGNVTPAESQIGSTGVYKFTMPDNAVTITDVTTDGIAITDAYYSKTGKLHVISPTGNAAQLTTIEAIAEYINNNEVGVLKGLTATAEKKPNGDPAGISLSNGTSIDITDIVVGSALAKVKVDNTPVIAADAAASAHISDVLALEKISLTNTGVFTFIMLDKDGETDLVSQATDDLSSVALTDIKEIKTNAHKGWAQMAAASTYTATKTAGVGATAGAEWDVTLVAGQANVVTAKDTKTYLPIGATVNLSVSPKAKIVAADNNKGGITFTAGSNANLTYTATTQTPFPADADIETSASVTVEVAISAAKTAAGAAIVLTPANVTP